MTREQMEETARKLMEVQLAVGNLAELHSDGLLHATAMLLRERAEHYYALAEEEEQ